MSNGMRLISLQVSEYLFGENAHVCTIPLNERVESIDSDDWGLLETIRVNTFIPTFIEIYCRQHPMPHMHRGGRNYLIVQRSCGEGRLGGYFGVTLDAVEHPAVVESTTRPSFAEKATENTALLMMSTMEEIRKLPPSSVYYHAIYDGFPGFAGRIAEIGRALAEDEVSREIDWNEYEWITVIDAIAGYVRDSIRINVQATVDGALGVWRTMTTPDPDDVG